MAEKDPQQAEFAARQTTWFRVLQFMLIALLASTVFLTGDGTAVADGMTSWLVLGFTFAGSVWGIYQMLFPAVRFYRQWPGFLLALSVAFMLIAVFANMGNGDFRASLNSWWQWVAFAVGLTLINQLFHTERLARGAVAVMLAVAVALSCIGIYDSLVKIPELRAEYFAGDSQQRVEMLQSAGIADTRIGSPSRYHFESRIQSPEPHVTFALSNSLAGFLAPWFTLLLLIILRPGHQLSRKKELPKLLALIGILAFCLTLTKSRSACCAVVLSLLVAGILLKSHRKLAVKASMVLGGVGCVVFVLGVATHRLDTKILTEAVKSLSFRMEYWENSTAMAADNLWTGVGPGNFRDSYLLYKKAASSESIADPHNWPLEVLTSFGVPVLLLVCMVFVTGYQRFRRLARKENEMEEGNSRTIGTRFPDLSANWIYFAGGVGCLIGLLIDQFSYALVPLRVFYIALPVYATVIFMLQDWVDRGVLNRHHLLVAFLCWLLNLMVAGGIAYPGVGFTGWLLFGLAVSRQRVLLKPDERVCMSKSQRWAILAITVTLPVLVFLTFHHPVTASDYHLMNARFYLRQGQSAQAMQHLQQATEADAYQKDAYILSANIRFMRLRDSVNENDLRAYQTFVTKALEINTKSQTTYELFAQQALLLYQYHQLPEVLDRALEYTERELELYPESAYIWSRLAACQYYAGELEEMKLSIQRAINLDKANPHLEFKLSNRRLLEPEFAGWQGRGIYFEEIDESVEQSLHYLRKKRKEQ